MIELAYQTDEAYYADHTHVSASMIKVLSESPQEYYQRFIAHTMQDEDTDAMRFGRAFHAYILEPITFATRFAVAPKCDKRTTKGKEEYAEFMAANAGKELVDAQDIELLKRLRDAIHTHKFASAVLSKSGLVEHSIKWEADGLNRKAKPDFIIEENAIAVDLKTTDNASPASFADAIGKYKYHLQAAWYLGGLLNVSKTENYRFIFIACSKKPPYSVAVYEIEDEDIDFAWNENERIVSELLGRIKHNHWRAEWESGINKIKIPSRYKSNYYQLGEVL